MDGFGLKRVLRLAPVIVIVATCLTGWSGAMAQDGKPGTERITPEPGTCQVEARTIEELKAIFAAATPVAETELPASVSIPTGHPADAVSAAGVVATVHGAFACINAGDFLRFFSLLTDHAIVTAFPWLAEAVATADGPADLGLSGVLPADQRQTVLAVAGITRLGDGRVGASIAFLDPVSDAQGADSLYLMFVLDVDRWRIDEVFDFSAS